MVGELAELVTPALEVSALGGVLCSRDRHFVGVRGGGCLSEAAEEVGAHGVESVVVGEVELVDEGQRRRGAVDLGDRDGAVERHDRGRLQGQQVVVERDDLPPVGRLGGRGIAVDCVDRGLELVGAGLVAAQAAAKDRLPLLDEGAVPAAAVLVGERDEPVARVVTRAATR